jgi:flagellar biosynthesis chaperone FliJ
MSFPLQTLLDLRRRSEDEAAQAMASALARTALSEAEQRRLEECAAAAWARANLARGQAGPATAGEALAAERFHDRLAGEARGADQAALTHRKGPLAVARAEEAAARERHAAARRERQAAEQAGEREAAEQRRVAGRRAEDALSDLAAARRRG